MPSLTAEVYSPMGLSAAEYELIARLLGREPTYTELGMFAVMWSEHCGYKYSRPVLAAFKKYKEALDSGGFENAGVVDLGGGMVATMKVESHNHPSAVEPYQGAATGVGGIIRDVLTMGARPIALLNSLRFGPIHGSQEHQEVARNRYLFEHVVGGIAGYGNCVGVPTVGGEVQFHRRYSGNPLVNAMCVGIMRADALTTSAAAGPGNPVVYLGSATGKDGIHGATFASAELDEDSDAKRPNVQIGDPFAEKQLIEATLEALATGAIVAIQDMGAAGLTCSTVEMSSKGKVGMDIDLDLVPARERDMSAYELMLSESQERMLAVAEAGREAEVIEVFERWGQHAVVIGSVSDSGRLVVTRLGKVEADLDPSLLTDHCPTYRPPAAEPAHLSRAAAFDFAKVPVSEPRSALISLLGSPNIASKRWIYRQYDHQVQTQTTVLPGQGDAAVVAPRDLAKTGKALSLSLDGNARKVFFDPRVGGQLAVAEAARNVACTGAVPRAVTDGLNFGSPEDPHVFWQFREAVQGIAEAAEAMGTPVISGNVSFYNESELGEVLPTPVIGMLGVMEDARKAIGLAPRSNVRLGLVMAQRLADVQQGLGASEYLAHVHGIEDGRPGAPNLVGERALCMWLSEAAFQQCILSAHDISDGGLAVAAAEIALEGNGSVDIALSPEDLEVGRLDAVLFGELPGAVIVGVAPGRKAECVQSAQDAGLGFLELGNYEQGSAALTIEVQGLSYSWSNDEMASAYFSSIPLAMDE